MSGEDTYRTIEDVAEGLFKDRGSKFIALAIPVRSEEEVKTELENLRKKYHDARHHAFAFRIGFKNHLYRMNDDGEPSSSAGRPIYGQIISLDLTNILVVVIRYFGGVKLGVGGLINAYKSAAKDALSHATVIINTINDKFEIHFGYDQMNEVMKILKEEGVNILTNDFYLDCKIKFDIRKQKSSDVFNRLSKIKNLKINHLDTI
jgi:uncharacterized YigZ family protein